MFDLKPKISVMIQDQINIAHTSALLILEKTCGNNAFKLRLFSSGFSIEDDADGFSDIHDIGLAAIIFYIVSHANFTKRLSFQARYGLF